MEERSCQGFTLFCTGIKDQPGRKGKSMENEMLMKWEMNLNSHPKAYSHAVWTKSSYT